MPEPAGGMWQVGGKRGNVASGAYLRSQVVGVNLDRNVGWSVLRSPEDRDATGGNTHYRGPARGLW
ncbi:hypothetical protein GCM10020369_77410 [Cryptosporangium minutisporangium]|uniref:Uncharacterized protein n=1 Tax=Cryptosporangium minutisporangium TaxID=113569 RepID=A0ABP6TBC6_9ACTN